MPPINLLCLANSQKHQGRCLAGIDMNTGAWVRPVSPVGDGTLFYNDFTCRCGRDPSVLDQIEVSLAGAAPQAHHPENWVIERRRPRFLGNNIGQQVIQNIRASIDCPGELIRNCTNRICNAEVAARPLERSLTLVRPQQFRLEKERYEYDGRERTRYRGLFLWGGYHFNLSISDVAWRSRLQNCDYGVYCVSDFDGFQDNIPLLTISVTEPFGNQQNDYFKLIAGIVTIDPDILE